MPRQVQVLVFSMPMQVEFFPIFPPTRKAPQIKVGLAGHWPLLAEPGRGPLIAKSTRHLERGFRKVQRLRAHLREYSGVAGSTVVLRVRPVA